MGTFKTQMLWDSIRKSDLTATIGLLESGNINLEERDENGQTFLMLACEFGEINIVRELLEAHVDPNSVDTDNWSALMYSAKEGHLDILIELLEKGANLDHRDMLGWSALMWASYKGKDLIVHELLERGANPNIKAELNMTCLAWASGRGHTETVKLLLQKGAQVNAPDKYGTTPLIWACRKGYLEIVEALLDEGANVDAVGMNSWTALLVSTRGGFSEVTNQLLEYDPNVNAVDKDGFTALTIAAKDGYVEIAHDVLAKGAYVNLADRAGDTILIHAVKGGHAEVVRALINKYADVDVEGSEGKTALYWAVEKGHTEIVKILLHNEPDLEICNKDEDTPLLRAVRNRFEQCVRLLLDKGAKVSAVDKRGDTALHISLRARSKRITELLLRNPRNSRLLYRPNKSGETPYNIDAYHQKGILTQIFGHRNLNANDGENLLGYDIYSSALADILSEPSLNTPITVGLYAKWGSGKSFLMSKLQKEMKSFTRANRDEHFTFCWTLFIVLLIINNIVGLTLAVTDKWEVGLGVGFGLFPVEYAFLGLIYLFTHIYNVSFAMRISLLLGRKLLVLTLLLEVLFFNPKHRSSSSSYNEPAVRFLFSESTKLTSVGGEKALAAMIGTLADTLELEYGFIVARLFRVFKPQSDKLYSGRFKSLCCIPYFVIVYLVFLSIEVGIYLLVWSRAYQQIPNTVAPVTQSNLNITTTMETTTIHFNPLEQNTAIYAILITVGCIVGFAILSNIYTWGQAVMAMLMSQKRRIYQAAEQIDKIKMDGLMQRLKSEVDLMSKFVTCMDKFTQNQTRLVVIVDGLDSCEQDKVLQVLDIIKALFSDEESPFITILAVDPHIIIKGIESNINKTFQDSNVNGFDYLRNVVHLPFYLQSQGMAITKQDLTKSSSTFEVSGHSSESPSKGQKTFQHQESVLSNSSVASDVRRRSRKSRQDSTGPLITSSFDLTNTLTKTDYFSDVNPRSIRRLKNIVAVTARLLRAYNIEFSWHRLASWINIIEQWPYRVSWIICYFEENEITDNTTTLLDIYRKIADKIPTSKEVEPLLEIDRNVRKMKAFLGSGSSNSIVLNLGDLKKFLPCTINLDPYLRKLIRELQKNTDVLRQDFPMGPMFPGSPSSGASGAGQGVNKMNMKASDMILNSRRLGSFRSNVYPSPAQFQVDQSLLHPQMLPYGMMPIYPQGFGNMPFMPTGYPENQATATENEPSALIQGYQDEKLTQMSVEDVCQLLSNLKGINPAMTQQYQTLVVDNNISGLVLSSCNIDELGKVMNMRFGDWQLFKSALVALREKEVDLNCSSNLQDEEQPYGNQSDGERSTKSLSTDGGNSQASTTRSSNYDGHKNTKGGENKNRKLSTDRGFENKKFETINESDENDEFSEKREGRMNRTDSTVQQVVFESGLLREAMISFTEEDEEEEEEYLNVVNLEEPKIQKPSVTTQKISRPVKFSLDFKDDSFEIEEEDNDSEMYKQPLLPKSKSPPIQMGYKSPQSSTAASSSLTTSPLTSRNNTNVDKTNQRGLFTRRSTSLKDGDLVNLHKQKTIDETERVYIVDEVQGQRDQRSAEENIKEHMMKSTDVDSDVPLQMVTFSNEVKTDEDIAHL